VTTPVEVCNNSPEGSDLHIACRSVTDWTTGLDSLDYWTDLLVILTLFAQWQGHLFSVREQTCGVVKVLCALAHMLGLKNEIAECVCMWQCS
jgi:hypothetical protein